MARHGHPEMALRGYDDDREATTGPRDEEDDDSDKGELDADYMHSEPFNPPHLPGGNGATRRPGRSRGLADCPSNDVSEDKVKGSDGGEPMF